MERTHEKKRTGHIEQYLHEYISQSKDIRKRLEFEIRFGKRKYRYITKSDFEHVIARLKELGFHMNSNEHLLRASSVNHDIRTEIRGLHGIQHLCRKEEIESFMKDEVKREMIFFHEKVRMKTYPPMDYREFGFRVSLQEETELNETDTRVQQVVNMWEDTPKFFRLMNRLSATHPELKGIRVDMSIVKTNAGEFKEHKTIKQSNIFQSRERFEIEIEYENHDETIDMRNGKEILMNIKRVISYILQGLQETSFPISYDEMTKVELEYLKLFKNEQERNDKEQEEEEEDKDERNETMRGGVRYRNNDGKKRRKLDLSTYRITPSDFIGPSSISLERKHILESTGVNILNDYTVTDKADGMRKLLYISSEGKMYFISSGMKIQFTGYYCNAKSTLLDGEHIIRNKNNQAINLYAAFDMYILNGKDIRASPFLKDETEVRKDENASASASASKHAKEKVSKTRFDYLSMLTKQLDMYPVGGADKVILAPLRVERKNFYLGTKDSSIFRQSKHLLDMIDSDAYEYETDGLIYTPAFKGVAIGQNGKLPSRRVTWRESFKWKPAEYNSIDFLVRVMKENDTDIVKHTTKMGLGVSSYKTLVLNVGYDEMNKEHGLINPCKSMLNNEDISVLSGGESEYKGKRDTYRPMPFTPTSPSDDEAMICHITLRDGVMYAEDDSIIRDNTIIECRYDNNRENGWKWIPMRVRHDKTAELQKGMKQFGNAYNVANSVWQSIHHPITRNMIKGLEKVVVEENNEQVYYNRNDLNHTQQLRSFHNLYVKSKLIRSVSPTGGHLLDLAVGKAGDLSKWRMAKLGFVLGIDISQDNIENRMDGACVRYLRLKASQKDVPDCIFLQGKSHERVKDGTAMFTDKGREVIKALYGYGPRDKMKLDKQVYAYYGVGKTGFNVVSCQFAIHYFFSNKTMLESFIQNVSEGCELNGYFIGTMYDGATLFEELESKQKGESISEFIGEHKIWEVTKMYDKDTFEGDETSLGMAIDVYQESINQTLTEYLVHFDYFKSLMKDYGFTLLEKTEAREIGLPNSTGMFKELHYQMNTEVNRDIKERGRNSRLKGLYREAMKLDEPNDASSSQRRISFMNRYFVFKKIRDHNFNKIGIKESILEGEQVDENTDMKTDGDAIGTGTERDKNLVSQVTPDKLMSVSSKANQLENQRTKKMDLIEILIQEQSNKKQYQHFIQSLKQISMGCHKAFSDSSFVLFIRQLVRDEENMKLTDYEIYQRYNTYMKEKVITKESPVKSYNRGENRAKLIMDIVSKSRKAEDTILRNVETYLDYGCGDGEITKAVAKGFNVDSSKVYCSDIKQYPSLVNMQFVKSVYGEPLQIGNDSIDMITTQMVLHHIDDKYLDYVLRDLHRVLKPGGILVVREHDAPSNIKELESFQKVVDITHDIYDYVIEAEMSWKEKDDYYSKYRSVRGTKGWDALVKRAGFKVATYQKRVNRKVESNPNATTFRIYYKGGYKVSNATNDEVKRTWMKKDSVNTSKKRDKKMTS